MIYENEVIHSGVKNMKWGERRYQNEDGSLTPLGREHYGVGPARSGSEKRVFKKKKPKTVSSAKEIAVKEKKYEKRNSSDIKSMTVKELKEAKNRMDAEREYLVASRNLKDAQSADTIGKKIALKFRDKAIDAVVDLAVNTGKDFAKDRLYKKLKINIPKDSKDKKN